MRKRFEDWIYGGGPPFPLDILFTALSVVYGFVVRLRLLLYKKGLFRTKRLACRVISVGNITVGGSGKTPVAMELARFLKKEGYRVAVLSRGYGGSRKGPSIVSDGKNILLGPEEAGDEPCMMAGRLEGVPVVTGADRYRAGLLALERFGPDILVLDDGFQHMALHRDLDLVLVDGRRGFGNGRLLPRGILREPVEGLSRADAVLLKDGGGFELPGGLDMPLFRFSLRPLHLRDLGSGKNRELDFVRGKRVLALSGIADPEPFVEGIKGLGAESMKVMSFPDHHLYTLRDMEDIRAAAEDADLVLTTEKDAVKLRKFIRGADPELYVLVVEAAIEDKFFAFLNSFLKGDR